jgi:diacylglycerol kinase
MTGIEPSNAWRNEPFHDPIPQGPPRRRRPWRAKFKDAFRGLKWGVRGHSSFFVHFFIAALVLAAGLIFRCSWLEWCVLIGCIGMVLTAELFNSAVETLFRGLDEATKERVWPALDISAGAVLLTSLTAGAVGLFLLLPKLALWLGLL